MTEAVYRRIAGREVRGRACGQTVVLSFHWDGEPQRRRSQKDYYANVDGLAATAAQPDRETLATLRAVAQVAAELLAAGWRIRYRTDARRHRVYARGLRALGARLVREYRSADGQAVVAVWERT